MLLNYLLILTSFILPKPGSIYENKINIPLIGKQYITAEILSNSYANIKLRGLINENGTIRNVKNYFSDDTYKLSYNLQKIIKTYGTTITFPIYDEISDEIIFNINIKYINYRNKIIMVRIN